MKSISVVGQLGDRLLLSFGMNRGEILVGAVSISGVLQDPNYVESIMGHCPYWEDPAVEPDLTKLQAQFESAQYQEKLDKFMKDGNR